MTLVINIGNTNLTLALADETTLTSTRIPIGSFTDPTAAVALLKPILTGETLTACTISTVVPEKNPFITAAVEILAGITPQIITHEQIALDCTSYQTKAGIDRLLCCEVLYAEHQAPCLLFDLGTATTANVVDAQGSFLGGAITAGVALGLEALRSGTSQLDFPTRETALVQLIGTDMNACMTTGATLSAAGFLIYYREKIAAHLGATPHTVITGGNAPCILPHLPPAFIHRPNLLLEGILRHTKSFSKEGNTNEKC